MLRAWFEPGFEGGVRVRITATTDVGQLDPATMIASSPAEVCLIVERWLARFLDLVENGAPDTLGAPDSAGHPGPSD